MLGSLDLVLAFFLLCAPTTQASPADNAGSTQSQAASQPNPDASGKYHVGDGVSPPKLLVPVDPDYPDRARRKKVQGSVALSLTVDSQGKPEDVRVVHPRSETVGKKLRPATLALEDSAVKAVKQYRFDPGLFQGKPVPVEITVEVDYRVY